MQNPLVSVGILNFNGSCWVEGCLRSIVEQTYANIEVIIVDDYSSDNSKGEIKRLCRLLKKKNVRCIFNKRNLGVARSANILKGAFSGDFWLIVSSDDVLMPKRIELGVSAMRSDQDLIFCYSNMYWWYKFLNFDLKLPHFSKLYPPPKSLSDTLSDCRVPVPTLFFNSERTKTLWFDHKYSGLSDYHFLLKCYELGPSSFIDDYLMLYRRHGKNYSQNKAFFRQRKKLYLWIQKHFPNNAPEAKKMRKNLIFYKAKSQLLNGDLFASLVPFCLFVIFGLRSIKDFGRAAQYLQSFIVKFYLTRWQVISSFFRGERINKS